MNTHRAVAEEFARRVVSILGDQVESVILYGSVARGEAVPESDIDILVIGDDSCHLRDVTSEIAFDIDREGAFTFLISPFTIEHRGETTSYSISNGSARLSSTTF